MKTLTEVIEEFYRDAQIEGAPQRSELFRAKYSTNEVSVVATVCVRRENILYLGVKIDDGRCFICASESAFDHLCSENITSLFRNVLGYTGQGWIEVEV